MLNQPMSSPMMKTMFGFLAVAWALAGMAPAKSRASAAAVERSIRNHFLPPETFDLRARPALERHAT